MISSRWLPAVSIFVEFVGLLGIEAKPAQEVGHTGDGIERRPISWLILARKELFGDVGPAAACLASTNSLVLIDEFLKMITIACKLHLGSSAIADIQDVGHADLVVPSCPRITVRSINTGKCEPSLQTCSDSNTPWPLASMLRTWSICASATRSPEISWRQARLSALRV